MRAYVRPAPLRDVLEEHVEEGAFLYHARRRCFVDGRFAWSQALSREERLDAHLHALKFGGRASAEVLIEKLSVPKDGDAGEPFVAAAVIPSLNLIEPMELLAEAIAADPPHGRTLVDGLRYTANAELMPWIFDFLKSDSACLRAAGAKLLGNLWPNDAEVRLQALQRDADAKVRLAAGAALASRSRPIDINALGPLLDALDSEISLGAARVLLASGDDFTLDWLRRRMAQGGTSADAATLLAVAGNLDDASLFLKAPPTHTVDGAVVLEAYGRSGAVAMVEPLLAELDHADFARATAFRSAWLALGTFSGLHRPVQFDLEDDGPEPARAYAAEWRGWWKSAGTAMPATLKHRCGRPLSPGALAADLQRTGNTARDLTFLELQARYRCPLVFDADARHEVQSSQIATIASWASEVDSRFPPGASYFAGKRL